MLFLINSDLYFYIISHIIVSLLSFIIGLIVFTKNKTDTIARIFFLFTISVSLWAGSYSIWLLSNNYQSALFWSRLLNLFATFIPLFYIHWVISFLKLNERKSYKNLLIIIYGIALFFISFSFSSYYVKDVGKMLSFSFWPQAGWLYKFFILFFWSPIITGSYYLLIKALLKTRNKKKKKQLLYIILGTSIGFLGGSTNFLLMLGIKYFPPFGSPLVVIFPLLFGYAMARYQLMNIKIFTTQILIVVLNIIAFINIFFSQDIQEYVIRILFFIGIILISFLLNQSFNKEVEHREKLEQLTKKLEISNKKLKEIDRNKTEFVSLASHQLRTPATAIKGFISLAKEGNYGKVSPEMEKVLGGIEISTDRLLKLIEDLLNISRMEMGKLKYVIEKHSLCEILRELKKTFFLRAKQKGLRFSLTCDDSLKNKKMEIDREKIEEVFSNIIDNAIKYTEKGSVSIKVFNQGNSARIEIKDTGIGIDSKDKAVIFDKFIRGSESNKFNTSGLGIGIYLAKNIINFHNGKIWVESKGHNKGSKFIVEIPYKSKLLEEVKRNKIKKEIGSFIDSI